MRRIAEYLDKAAEFDALARDESHSNLKKCYSQLAEGYRKLAAERQGMISDLIIQPEPPLTSN